MDAIEAMQALLERQGLAGFLRSSSTNGWRAPVIPSKWSVEHVPPADARPRAMAARRFGSALLDAIDALAPEMRTAPSRELAPQVELLIDLVHWVGATEGYGNQLFAGHARDVAVVGLARMLVDEAAPVAEIRRLLDRTWAPFDCPTTIARASSTPRRARADARGHPRGGLQSRRTRSSRRLLQDDIDACPGPAHDEAPAATP